jgi:putative transposase
MDERLKFIARLLDGEKMAAACRDFGISRKTGYKILTRYHEIGLDGRNHRSARTESWRRRVPAEQQLDLRNDLREDSNIFA